MWSRVSLGVGETSQECHQTQAILVKNVCSSWWNWLKASVEMSGNEWSWVSVEVVKSC